MTHIIFDCDGVLVDSEPLSMQADTELLASYGIAISAEDAHRRFVGKTFAAMMGEISAEFGMSVPADASARKDARLLELYEAELKAVAGVAEALAALMPRALSVASNSPAARVAAALRITGLTEFFGDRIISFEHVAAGKPAPDVFIEAARRAGATPQNCIVVEDSVTGVTAARRAGCLVLGFTGTYPYPEDQAQALLAAGAATTFSDMRRLPALIAENNPLTSRATAPI